MEEKPIEPEERKNQSAQIKKASDKDGTKENPLAWDEPDATEFEK